MPIKEINVGNLLQHLTEVIVDEGVEINRQLQSLPVLLFESLTIKQTGQRKTCFWSSSQAALITNLLL